MTGRSFTGVPGEIHAFLYIPGSGMVDLGTLGGTQSDGKAVNASGHVAGSAYPSAGNLHAFLWTPGGGMVDLGTLPGGARREAFGLDDAGRAVGSSDGSFGFRATLWRGGSVLDLNTSTRRGASTPAR